MKDYLEHYIQEQKNALESIPIDSVESIIEDFKRALKEDRQIFVFGNGGSATNASHFVTDLGKSSSDKAYRRFRVLCLNESVSWITAIGNDYAYEDIYVRQLENYARPGDIVLALGVSGNSPNLVKAIEFCKKQNIYTIALTGGKKSRLAELSDKVITINSNHYGRVEDCQMHICHMICYAFIERPELQQE